MPTKPAKPSKSAKSLPCKKGRPAEIDRGQLLDAAEKLFAEKGFAGTTTREVVKRAHCNLALISYYFGGKDGLYEAVLRRHFERFRDQYSEIKLDEAVLARDWPELAEREQRSFCAHLFEFSKMIATDSPMQKVLCREMMTGAAKMATVLRGSEGGAYRMLSRLIEDLQKGGELREDLDIRYCVVGLIGPVVYSIVAAPVLKEIYGFGALDLKYVRGLCLQQTRIFFEGCGTR